METVISFIGVIFFVVFGFFFVSLIASIFYGMIAWFFSSTKCPNCAKTIRTEGIRCPRCGNFLIDDPPQEEPNPEIYARIKALVIEQIGASPEKIHPDTLLADDLGIAGDDGWELLVAFCEEFEIQNRCEIEPYEYFGPEAFDPLPVFLFFYYLIFDREKLKDNESVPPLTLRDLVKSAEAKRWIPPRTR